MENTIRNAIRLKLSKSDQTKQMSMKVKEDATSLGIIDVDKTVHVLGGTR